MSNLTKVRLFIAIIVGISALAAVYYFKPVYSTNPQGIILPAAHVLAPSDPTKITVYANAPLHYQSLGQVRVELHDNGNSSTAYTQMTSYAQKLAATVGANGIIVKGLYHTKEDGVNVVLSSYQFYATAVYVGK
jgi:hypothetical protein